MVSELFKRIDEKTVEYKGRRYTLYQGPKLEGERYCFTKESSLYPAMLKDIPRPPKELHLIGNPECLHDACIALIGARRATPYGLACAQHFAFRAAEKGLTIASGGAFGCDSASHKGALDAGGRTIVFLGGGCDQIYPQSNYELYQKIIEQGGAIVSERDWEFPALPFTFLERNRLIAGIAQAVLIVEAGLPSGTFTTADEALAASREVLVIPSAITSHTSAGSNRLLYQGATPIVDDESFDDVLFSLYGILKQEDMLKQKVQDPVNDPLLSSLLAEPLRLDDILEKVTVPKRISKDATKWLRMHLVELESQGLIKRFPDGRYGPARL